MTTRPNEDHLTNPAENPDLAPLATGHCPNCTYDLTGLAAGLCPECGTEFDPADPKSILLPEARSPRHTRLRNAILVTLSIIILIIVGLQHTIIPRPVILRSGAIDPRLWVWLGEPYGTMVVDEPQRRLRLHWWEGEISKITATSNLFEASENKQQIQWEIQRFAKDDWKLTANTPGVPFQDILYAFNSMRSDDELLGVQIPDYQRDRSEQPFEVRGARHTVLEKLIEIYGLTVHPGYIPDSPGEAWVWNEQEKRLERITRQEADQRGIDIRPLWGYGSVPRWDWRR